MSSHRESVGRSSGAIFMSVDELFDDPYIESLLRATDVPPAAKMTEWQRVRRDQFLAENQLDPAES